jgi:hypothetical protein
LETFLPIRGWFLVTMVTMLGSLASACETGSVSDPEAKVCAAFAAVGVVCPGGGAGTGDPPAPESWLCGSEQTCASDAECTEAADSSCNTNTGKCQLVQCAPATGECSNDRHCREGRRCDSDVCIYDPTPYCYSSSSGVCREGAWEGGTGDWRSDCEAEGGEVVPGCPDDGRLGVCRYDTAHNEPVAIWIYDAEIAPAAQMSCMDQMNGMYTPANDESSSGS